MADLVIVSDHGMTANANFDYEPLSDHMSDDTIAAVEKIVGGTNVMLKDPSNQELTDKVVEDLKQWPELKVYKKAEVPEYYGLKNAEQVNDILILPKNRTIWGVDNANPNLYEPPAGPSNDTQEAQKQGGNHGYEDITDGYETEGNFADMRTIFMAIGPSFKVWFIQKFKTITRAN